MQSKSIWTIIYLSANLIALLLFWMAVSAVKEKAKMEDGPDGPDFGDSLNFITTALPILLLSLLFNIAYAIKALTDIFRRRDYLGIAACGLTFAIWFAFILVIRMTG